MIDLLLGLVAPFTGFHLLAAAVLLAVAGGWLLRWIEDGAIRVALKPPTTPVDDYLIHQKITHPEVHNFREPARKGFTKDDRVVELASRRRAQ